jgi:predicted ester cyclase
MTGTASTGTPVSEKLALVQRLIDEGFAIGNPDIVDELFAPDVVVHQLGEQGEIAREHLKQAVLDMHRAFPDLTHEIEDTAEVGHTLWVRATLRGTATGPYFGRPPSNRPVEFTAIDILRIVEGQIVEHWGGADRFALLTQTGVLDEHLAAPD